MNDQTVARLIAGRIADLDISVREAARRIDGLSETRLRQIVAGASAPPRTLAKIVDILGVTGDLPPDVADSLAKRRRNTEATPYQADRVRRLAEQNVRELRKVAEAEAAARRRKGDSEGADVLLRNVDWVAGELRRVIEDALAGKAGLDEDDVDVVTRTVAADPGESPGAITPEPDAAAP